jgi:hypothetical protein
VTLDDLQLVIKRTDAFARATMTMFDETPLAEADRQHLERLAHLVGATAEAAAAAVAAMARLKGPQAIASPPTKSGKRETRR